LRQFLLHVTLDECTDLRYSIKLDNLLSHLLHNDVKRRCTAMPLTALVVGATAAEPQQHLTNEELFDCVSRATMMAAEQRTLAEMQSARKAQPLVRHCASPTLACLTLDSVANAACGNSTEAIRYSALSKDFFLKCSAAGESLYAFWNLNLAGGLGAWQSYERQLITTAQRTTLRGFGIDVKHVREVVSIYREMCADPLSPLYSSDNLHTLWVLVGDATKVRERVHYVPATQQAFGLSLADHELSEFPGGGVTLPCPKETTSDEIKALLKPFTLATEVYEILGQPMCGGAPAFDLAVWAQGGRKAPAEPGGRGGFSPDATVHLQRRAMLITLLRQCGITVCACASDGESASTSASYGTFTIAPAKEHYLNSPAHAAPQQQLSEQRYLSAVTFRPRIFSVLVDEYHDEWLKGVEQHNRLCDQHALAVRARSEFPSLLAAWYSSDHTAPPPLPPLVPEQPQGVCPPRMCGVSALCVVWCAVCCPSFICLSY